MGKGYTAPLAKGERDAPGDVPPQSMCTHLVWFDLVMAILTNRLTHVEGGDVMKVIGALAEIMKREGVQFLGCYPTTPIIKPHQPSVFGPICAGRSASGRVLPMAIVASPTASHSVCSPCSMGQALNASPGSLPRIPIRPRSWCCRSDVSGIDQVFPFSSARTYASVTKSVETLNLKEEDARGHASSVPTS